MFPVVEGALVVSALVISSNRVPMNVANFLRLLEEWVVRKSARLEVPALTMVS